jgi:hypothetical protein
MAKNARSEEANVWVDELDRNCKRNKHEEKIQSVWGLTHGMKQCWIDQKTLTSVTESQGEFVIAFYLDD